MKVFCEDCFHLDKDSVKVGGMGLLNFEYDEYRCNHHKNKVLKEPQRDSWLKPLVSPAKYHYLLHPSELNKDNDCPLFERLERQSF